MVLRVAILAFLVASVSAFAPPLVLRSSIVVSARIGEKPGRKEYNLNSPDGNYGLNDGNGAYGVGNPRWVLKNIQEMIRP